MALRLLVRSLMSRPRQVLPRSFYMITRCTTQRQFLLRPDEETNNAFAYCLAEAVARFDLDLLLSMAESNHHHTIVFDRHGKLPAFMEHFHKMLARCLNARWGRWENFWAAEEVCATHLLDRAAVIDKLVYAATNPVKDHLVDRVQQWPGFNSYLLLVHGKPIRARRPTHFFRDKGIMPETVRLELTIPPELGEAGEVIEELKARVRAVEDATREARCRDGKRVLGIRRVREQSWRGSPDSVEPRRRLRPRFAGAPGVRLPALESFKLFLVAYRAARLAWKAGTSALFPRGTYQLAKVAPIAVED